MDNTKQPKHFIGSGENWISPGATSPIALALRIFERGEGEGEAGQPVTLTPCSARQWRSLPLFRSLGNCVNIGGHMSFDMTSMEGEESLEEVGVSEMREGE
ncbi:hypothetical protein Bpfe_025239 [Biomphalaria pfeifferi]|uniref:Uncharacterized protein n=1 Tax=Biomphalaria pfeifferi TaxID=112525 RepID=A0AAD8AZV4_BIOPF|nr:hypothetical protein Bpfe_025239 [Biomphalaria pfeifferi]